jgi:hypothetical protein
VDEKNPEPKLSELVDDMRGVERDGMAISEVFFTE